MDGRQKPDAQSDNAIDLNDDEVIDLTQVIQEGEDDGIIDLTNVMDQPAGEPEALEEDADPLSNIDDAIIDLAEPAEADERTDASVDEKDDAFIDLTDVETTLDAEMSEAMLDGVEDTKASLETMVLDAGGPPTDEPEEIEDLDLHPDAPVMDIEEEMDLCDEDEDTDDQAIIDLTETHKTPDEDLSDHLTEGNEDDEGIIDLMDAVEPATQPADVPQAGVVDGGAPPAAPDEPSAANAIPLSEQQIEAALERTIHKIYAEKIEQLMIQTIEKTVQREIDKIKQAILEEDDDASD